MSRCLNDWRPDCRADAAVSGPLSLARSSRRSRRATSCSTPTRCLLDAYPPASDLDALIQRYRTGAFRPLVHVYEPFADAEVDTVFGGDVSRWAEGIDWKLPGKKEQEAEDGALLQPVVRALLNRLKAGYAAPQTTKVTARRNLSPCQAMPGLA